MGQGFIGRFAPGSEKAVIHVSISYFALLGVWSVDVLQMFTLVRIRVNVRRRGVKPKLLPLPNQPYRLTDAIEWLV